VDRQQFKYASPFPHEVSPSPLPGISSRDLFSSRKDALKNPPRPGINSSRRLDLLRPPFSFLLGRSFCFVPSLVPSTHFPSVAFFLSSSLSSPFLRPASDDNRPRDAASLPVRTPLLHQTQLVSPSSFYFFSPRRLPAPPRPKPLWFF